MPSIEQATRVASPSARARATTAAPSAPGFSQTVLMPFFAMSSSGRTVSSPV
jgi:hypothetical protein